MENNNEEYTGLEIAVIGMACRVPGAENYRMLWENLIHGKESLYVTNEENQLNRLKIKNKSCFDNVFFNYSEKEASLMNPVHRIFHENVWEALEDSGYIPEKLKGRIGIYVGAGDDTSWKMYSMMNNTNDEVDDLTFNFITSKDFLASLIAYKLDLRGGVCSVNTACSTSLVAIHQACRSLLMGENKLALAGGVSITLDNQANIEYKEGLIYSKDGHCKAFDNDATGTVRSEGSGVVVLKRLNEAIKDNDHIYAVIKGSAINNDGKRRIGFAAPSIEGQSECIKLSHQIAQIETQTLGYIETHGTGTRLGDSVEIEALNSVFKNSNIDYKCPLGSVKTNLGHTNASSGVIGLIKASLCLKNKGIPPSLHFRKANEEIKFYEGPFYVNTTFKEWKNSNAFPLRVGVSSFGIGGTNAHVILEEAPPKRNKAEHKEKKGLIFSAKNKTSLLKSINGFYEFIKKEDTINLSDVEYTLQVGRADFDYRIAVPFQDRENLLDKLSDKTNIDSSINKIEKKPIVFLFSGIGTQYIDMGKELYSNQPIFKEKMDEGLSILNEITNDDYFSILFPENKEDSKINELKYAEPLLFLVEYALAYLLENLGVTPDYMLGQNVGEYVAASIEGVFSFREALELIVTKSKLLQNEKSNVLLSALMLEEEANEFITNDVSLAEVRSSQQVVFSGSSNSISELRKILDEREIINSILPKKYKHFSEIGDNSKNQFIEFWNTISTNECTKKIISSVTGELIKRESLASSEYWLDQMSAANKFYPSLNTILKENKQALFLGIGPGKTLFNNIKRDLKSRGEHSVIFGVLTNNEFSDFYSQTLINLWNNGVNIDWNVYHKNQNRNKLSLPTYEFEKSQYPWKAIPFRKEMLNKFLNQVTEDKETLVDHTTEYVTKNNNFQRDNVELKLKNILKDFFNTNTIDVDSDFIDLGIDSLNAMVLINKLRKEFDIELSLKEFFQCNDLRDVLAKIEKEYSEDIPAQMIEKRIEI